MGRTAAYLLAMLCGAVPAALACLCLRPRRKRRLAGRGLYSSWKREALLTLFWMFCGGMAVLTLMPRWAVWSLVDCLHGYGWNVGGYPFFVLGEINLIPFRTFRLDGHSLYMLLGNIVMFLPFGFFPAMLRADAGIGPYGQKYTWKRALVTGLCVTGFIECWQLLVGRAFDIDDLMLNTLGTLCGFWLWLLLRRAAPAFAERFWVKANSVT